MITKAMVDIYSLVAAELLLNGPTFELTISIECFLTLNC